MCIRDSYYRDGYDYTTDYQPAYAVGYANRAKYPAGTTFDSVESDLERSWHEVKGNSRLAWEDAKEAIRDGWDRTDARISGQEYSPRLRTVDGYAEGEEKGHPVATGTGALGGAAAGAAVGSVAGPVGTLVGGAIGAVAGSAAGHEVGEAVNPTTAEDAVSYTHLRAHETM